MAAQQTQTPKPQGTHITPVAAKAAQPTAQDQGAPTTLSPKTT